MPDRFVCALDLGTTHIKAGLFGPAGVAAGIRSGSVSESWRHPSGFEFDAEVQANLAFSLVRSLTEQLGRDVAAVAVASQRATVVPVSGDGAPAGPAISWQDSRCREAADRLYGAFGAERFARTTGLPPAFLWTASKLAWLREARPDLWAGTRSFVLLSDYMLRRLGAPGLHSDLSNASLTGLLDVTRREWSPEILAAAGVDRERLPGLVASGTVVGRVSERAAAESGLRAGTPLVAGGGDQQCSALGLGVLDPGEASLCLGTAAVVSIPSEAPALGATGRSFSTVHAAPGRYVVEGIQNAFGSALAWGSSALGCSALEELERLAEGAPSCAGGVRFLPHLAGIGSPDFDAAARGSFAGLELATGRAHLARAVVEGVALELGRVLDSVEAGTPPVRRLVVAGGVARRPFIAQVLSDVTGRAFRVSSAEESTLLGAAMLAWAGAGRFHDVREAVAACAATEERSFEPATLPSERASLRASYLEHVAKALS